MKVSVVIPAHNAADTLPETLDSLRAQTHPAWEAVVVDDGSTDDTAGVAARWAEQDRRVRVLSQAREGEAGARNAGVREACADWLLFLDADDWVRPRHLEQLTARIAADRTLDAAHCGSARVALDGTWVPERYQPPEGDLFQVLARRAAFPVHAVIVRRSLVQDLGGFDPSLCTSPDWDLWQRVARTGARFGAVREVLALYRMRPGSASMNAQQVARDGLTVLRRGHTADPRVLCPDPLHERGLPAEDYEAQAFYLITWCAGLLAGQGQDPVDLLNDLDPGPAPGLSAHGVADTLFDAVPVARCAPPASWPRLWPDIESRLDGFLGVLEERSDAAGLAAATRVQLERRVLEHVCTRPLTVGATHALNVEVTQPVADVRLPASVQRLQCRVELAGEHLGTMELPVCDGRVPADVLRDAIAARHAWRILGAYLGRAVYPSLKRVEEPEGIAILRNGLRLADHLPADEAAGERLHDRVGWLAFLQETWGRPDWPSGAFYDDQLPERTEHTLKSDSGTTRLEIGAPLPDVSAGPAGVDVLACAGGVPLILLHFEEPLVRAQRIRAAVTRTCEFELCRAVVREALLGAALNDPRPIRQRLADAARARVAGARAAGEAEEDLDEIVLGRPALEHPPAGSWRQAALPSAARPELLRLATTTAQPIVGPTGTGSGAVRIRYAPDILPAARTQARRGTTVQGSRLPILFYHRVAPAGGRGADARQVDPERFAAHVEALRSQGYRVVTLGEWMRGFHDERPLPGRPVALTFDFAYADLLTWVWPVLQSCDFRATVSVATGAAGGGSGRWGIPLGAHMLDWNQMRILAGAGVEFCSHTATARSLAGAAPEEIVREAATSREQLERELGCPVQTLVYPYGAEDEIVQHLVAACGYVCGLTRRVGIATARDPLLSLPRIEVRADMSAQALLEALHD